MEVQCIHSCHGLCNALALAEQRETAFIKENQDFLEQCNYPDVQSILRELIDSHRRSLSFLQEKRAELTAKINILDSINESFG